MVTSQADDHTLPRDQVEHVARRVMTMQQELRELDREAAETVDRAMESMGIPSSAKQLPYPKVRPPGNSD